MTHQAHISASARAPGAALLRGLILLSRL